MSATQNPAESFDLIAASTSANIVHLFHCAPFQCLRVFKLGTDPPGKDTNCTVASLRLVQATGRRVYLWCATVLGRIWRIPLELSYIGDPPKLRVNISGLNREERLVCVLSHSSKFCVCKCTAGLLGMELGIDITGAERGMVYGLLQPPGFIRFDESGRVVVVDTYEDDQELCVVMASLVPKETLLCLECCSDEQASWPAAVIGTTCGGLKLLLCGPDGVIQVEDLCRISCGSPLCYITVLEHTLVVATHSSEVIVVDLSHKIVNPSVHAFASPCRTAITLSGNRLRIFGTGEYRDYSVDNQGVSVEAIETHKYVGAVISARANTRLLVTVAEDGLLSAEHCEMEEPSREHDAYPSLKRGKPLFSSYCLQREDQAFHSKSLRGWPRVWNLLKTCQLKIGVLTR